jgi:hypothetical protein
MVVGRAFACTAYYELPYLVSSSSRSFIAYRLAKFGVQKLVRNSIIALFSQAKQSIIGARFSSTNFTFLRRKGSLDRLDRKPRDDFSAVPTPLLSMNSRGFFTFFFLPTLFCFALSAAHMHPAFVMQDSLSDHAVFRFKAFFRLLLPFGET